MAAMKLSDFVADFLARQGIRHVFAISGGASLHLIHSIAEHPDIEHVCPQHEQAGAMAADGYARATGNMGAAIATSGPGATNLITGICCSYYDSVPTIFITGQVTTFRFKGDTGVRQYGFQETDIVEMCRPVTKYVTVIKDPKMVRYELEKACYIARTGRPGPVLVDIPDNVQREQIQVETLEGYTPEPEIASGAAAAGRMRSDVERCLMHLYKARRPVLIVGWGVRLAKADVVARELIEKLGFPVVPTWGMVDFLPHDHPQLVGSFGTHGTRYGNFTVQNADLILAIGTRLDTHEAGSPLSTFARGATKIVVDIDPAELGKFSKFGMDTDLLICADAGEFIMNLARAVERDRLGDISDWGRKIDEWKTNYPICPQQYYAEEPVNPYVFVKTLSAVLQEQASIYVDTGCAIAWMMQAFEVKRGQRIVHDFNNTAMGYALPASIGACLALNRKPVICVTGDGSLQMNIQELATVLRHDLPIKIILLNNHGYSMIQQTQDQWLGSKYVASTVEGGLAMPDFTRVAQAYGYKTFDIRANSELRASLDPIVNEPGPIFCNVDIKATHRVIPQVKFGRPIEDPEPFIDRREFLATMIVPPLAVSRS